MSARVNSFPGTCPICKTRVESAQGVVWKDPVKGKWVTFCAADTPEDLGEIKPGYSGSGYGSRRPYSGRHAAPTTPPVATTNPVVHPQQVQSMSAVLSTGQQIGVTYPSNTAIVQKAGRGTTERLIVFSGPIHSASDGEVHHVSADNVLTLHGISPHNPPDLTVLFFGPANKQDYRPGPEDFVIGPRYTSEEYRDSEKALAIWLVQKGITR